MECSRSKELLSYYIDGIIDARTKALLEEHLMACKGCREDLASLKELVQEMGSLKSIEAPRDFLEKVHERIEQRSKFDQIIRKLFFPLRIKIPLELATVTAMAILILAVLNIQQPRKQQIAHVPLDSDQLMSAKKAKVDAAKPMVKMEAYKSKPSFEKAAAEPSVTEREIIELALLVKTEAFSKTYAPSDAKECAPTPGKRAGTSDEESIDVSSYAKTRIGRQAAPTAETKARELMQAKQALTSPKREEEVLTDEADVSFSYGDETLSKLKNLVERLDGKVISIEYEKRTEQPQSIQAEIPTEYYYSFCDGLRDIAFLQTTPPTISEKDQKVIQIRIRLIH
jgi:hypothetical protein